MTIYLPDIKSERSQKSQMHRCTIVQVAIHWYTVINGKLWYTKFGAVEEAPYQHPCFYIFFAKFKISRPIHFHYLCMAQIYKQLYVYFTTTFFFVANSRT